eukprot:8470359-Alexandrium_andersonii.AAC.1
MDAFVHCVRALAAAQPVKQGRQCDARKCKRTGDLLAPASWPRTSQSARAKYRSIASTWVLLATL